MKKLTILLIFFFTVSQLNAQNVAINNDGTSAAPSAMLEVKSTTKGFLMPRVTSAQRAAIVSPALGLLVFDTDTKTIWTYEGSAWKNLYTSGGGLVLPFSQSINAATSALQITNQCTGASIEGSSTAPRTGTSFGFHPGKLPASCAHPPGAFGAGPARQSTAARRIRSAG